jgi:hypothetical protein
MEITSGTNRNEAGPLGDPVVHAGSMLPIGGGTSDRFKPFRLDTTAHDGAYAVSFVLDITATAYRPDLRIVVDIAVDAGAIGIGCMVHDCSAFVDTEQTILAGRRRKVYVAMGAPGIARHLMLRNGSHAGPSVARVHAIEVRQVEPDEERNEAIQSSLWEVPGLASADFPRIGGGADAAQWALTRLGTGVASDLDAVIFPLAVTHTSRVWDWERCTQDFLRERYQRPGRLEGLPPFEELPSAEESRSYSGRLTLFDLILDSDGVHFVPTRCIDSELKANHVSRVENDLVVCCDDCVFVVSANCEVGAGDIERIDDPWFAGLQMVFPIDNTRCVVSASAPDALMVLDLVQRRVVHRWRVPAENYGRNYNLTDTMSVHDHYIANDMQLTHLNCAYPDGSGGFWISTLAQGDIGHVAADGTYDRMASGFIGCHGVRYSKELGVLYFSDSCTGRLIGLDAARAPRTLGSVDSRWLHDSQHLAGDLFILCVGDKNAIVVLDGSSNREIVRFDMRARGENVQFVNRIGDTIFRRREK